MTDFASIYETNVFTIKQDHLSTNSIHVSTCQWRRKQVESVGGAKLIAIKANYLTVSFMVD